MTDPDPDPANSIWLHLLLLLVLIFVNAFFSASEIALISLNDNKLKKMAEEGNKKAKKILALTENSSHFLATIQIGVTLAGFFTSALAAQSLADPFARWIVNTFEALADNYAVVHSVSVVLITLLMSYFTLVFGELVPKRVAMNKAERVAFGGIGILRAVSVIFYPFVRFLALSTNLIVWLFGIDPHAEEENVTEEEILMMVDVGEEKGVIEGIQKDMITNIFEFDDINAEDIMTPRIDVDAVDVEDSLEDALQCGVDNGYSRLPVYEEDIDHIIGVLYIKDLLPYVGRPIPAEVTLRHLIRETYFVPSTKKCGELFKEMTEKHLQMAIVVDEYGGMAGIVTVEDLLESIVGNMQDEYDQEAEELTQLDDHSFDADGSLEIEELSDRLGVLLPQGEYDTLAGFLIDQLGRIPGEDESPVVNYKNLTFTVTSMEERRIDRVHVEVLPQEEDADVSSKKE